MSKDSDREKLHIEQYQDHVLTTLSLFADELGITIAFLPKRDRRRSGKDLELTAMTARFTP